MRTVVRAILLLGLALAPLPLAAQEGDAFVLPPGMVRLRAAGELSRFDALFAGSGTAPFGSAFGGPVTAATFAPLAPLQGELNRFLTGAGSAVVANPETFRLGTLDLAATAGTRVVPLSLAAGVLPRLEVGVEIPLLRDEILFTRLGLGGSTLGANPDPAANADLLARFGDEWADLGAAAVLPTDSSALGRELQRLVAAAFPGESLSLPDSAAAAEAFGALNSLLGSELGLGPIEGRSSAWRVGDAQLSGRFAVLGTFGPGPLPPDSAGLHYRLAASASVRLPTGSEPDSVWLVSHLAEAGLSGFGAGLDGDLFLGRLWATASLRYAHRSEVEVVRRVASPAAPLLAAGLPQTVRWAPADLLSLRVAPRLRINDAVSIGGVYSVSRMGDVSFALASGDGDASVLDAEGGLAQALGLGVRYSTLPAYWGGAGVLPVEVALRYETTLSAPAGAPDASRMLVEARLFHALFGGRP